MFSTNPPRNELVLILRARSRLGLSILQFSTKTLRQPPDISLPITTPPWPSFIWQFRTMMFSLGTLSLRPSSSRPDLMAIQSSPVSKKQSSCKNILVEDCFFDTGDDCIAIKSGREEDGRRDSVPSENIIVRNCQMKDGHGGVVIGSEISGGCRNVFVENCKMDSPNLDRALRIKTNSLRGGLVENIYMRNCEIGEVKQAVLLINFYYEQGDAGTHTPIVRNVYLDNITSKKSKYAVYLRGYERSPIKNIQINNSQFNGVKQEVFIEHAVDITFNYVTINNKAYNLDN